MSLTALSSPASKVLDTVLTHLHPYQWRAFNTAIACTTIWILLRWLRTSRQRLCTTQLRGPHNESFLYGVGKRILDADHSGPIYEAWAKEYGPAYVVPSSIGSTKVVLCDPKAIAHFYAKETWTYVLTPMIKNLRADLFGRGLLCADGEDHKRQRRSLTPAFSVAAIRQVTPIFYNLAYKVKGAWDALIQSSIDDSAVIDVQSWMNHISLDTIGLACFSHNFGSLEGKHESVAEAFNTFITTPRSSAINNGLFVLSEVFPSLVWWPTPRKQLTDKLAVAMEEVSNVLLARTRKEIETGVIGGKEDRSIIGVLVKGGNGESAFQLNKREVMAQMKLLLVAGGETTSVSLTWGLLELSRNPDIQAKLRDELLTYGADPTYDQLTNDLPYLDAVVHETLRLHPSVREFTRMAAEDDVIPLSEPVHTKSGELVDSITIAEGTFISIPIESINSSAAIWGEDAMTFRPSRWLQDVSGQDGIPAKAKQVHGHRHLLTFVDGPRTCLGKNFAVTEFKVVLAVLVKNFIFEMRDGVDTRVEIGRGVLPRPKIAGEVGCKLPLRVRPCVA